MPFHKKRELEKSLAIKMCMVGNSTKPPARGVGRERSLLGYEKYLTRQKVLARVEL
jgi:hypothetical protein